MLRADSVHSFHKRTRKGKIIKVVQQKLTREDVGLGFLHNQPLLLNSVTCAVVVDTNILLHHIDILEHDDFRQFTVIICQTVLSETRSNNLSVYKRAMTLIGDVTKTFVFFPNEMSGQTCEFRQDSEVINDFNDRLIVRTAAFYRAQLPNSVELCLISNDNQVRMRAAAQNVETFTMRDFIVTKHLSAELLDFVSAPTQLANKTSPLCIEHLSADELFAGVRSAKYVKGALRVKNNCWHECYVVCHSSDKTESKKFVDINGVSNLNRALEGDIVVVELFGDQTDSTVSESHEIEGFINGNTSQTGRVVGILKRNSSLFRGSLMLTTEEKCGFDNPENFALFAPVTRGAPKIWLSSHRINELLGKRLVVQIDSWPASSLYPVGHCIQVLGDVGDKKVETQIVLQEFGVASEDFTTEVMSCLPPLSWEIGEIDLVGREDFRSIPITSIDPPGCKDIDDALHCIRLSNGRLQVGVHIADVTHFVKPDSPLDKEAAKRSTSTYLVERRLDMLPGLLTTQLCSLRSAEDHLAFSVIWEMDENANILDVKFCKSVIRSVASLTYDQAQTILDENQPNTPMNESVILLNHLAKILKHRRIEQGALTLASPEVKFRLDAETSNPTDVAIYAQKEANSLVEEFMLLANITVAKKILKHYPTLSILRRHQSPTIDQFRPLLIAANCAGVSLDVTSSKSLADSLDNAHRDNDPFFNKLLRILSTRCMMPAQYFCSGEIPKDQWHHYGLAAHVYTHFTSPIRRYADVLVHRLLSASIGVSPLPPCNSSRVLQQEQSTHMNRRHRAAQYAQRASVELYSKIFFENKKIVEEGYVIELSDSKMTVLIPRYGIECELPCEEIVKTVGPGGRSSFDEDRLRMEVFNEANVVLTVKILDKVSVEMNGPQSFDGEGITLRWIGLL